MRKLSIFFVLFLTLNNSYSQEYISNFNNLFPGNLPTEEIEEPPKRMRSETEKEKPPTRKEYLKSKIIQYSIKLNSLENEQLNKDYLFNRSKLFYQKELLKKPDTKEINLSKKFDSVLAQKEVLKALYEENKTYNAEIAKVNLISIKDTENLIEELKDSLRFARALPIKQIKQELSILNSKQGKYNTLMNDKIAETENLIQVYKDSLLNIFQKEHKITKLRKLNQIPINLPAVYQNPIKGKLHITSHYGSRTHPVTKEKHFHSGIDLRGKGVPVYSVLPGKVSKVNYDKKLGIFIEVEHANGYKTIYGHLSKFFVLEEDKIDLTKPIGVSGNSGRSTAAHLHFTAKKDNEIINPKYLLNL